MQPIGCFLRLIGHTCPLSGAKTGAQVWGLRIDEGKGESAVYTTEVFRQSAKIFRFLKGKIHPLFVCFPR